MVSKFFPYLRSLIVACSVLMVLFLLLPLLNLPGRWYQLALVKSASMEPVLPVGSLALYRPAASYQPGEIVAYLRSTSAEDVLIIHRIQEKITQDGTILNYLIQGDANPEQFMETVAPTQIEGKLIAQLPYLGFLIDGLKSRLGLGLLILFLLILVVIELVRE